MLTIHARSEDLELISKRLRPGDVMRARNLTYSSMPAKFENELCRIVEFDRKTLSWVVEFFEVLSKGRDDPTVDGVALAKEIQDRDVLSGKVKKHGGDVVHPRARLPAHRLFYDL